MSQHPRPTRSEQREAARAKARELREARQKGDKRKKLMITLGVIVAVAAVIGTVSWVVVNFSQTSQINGENAKKVPANLTAQDGLIIGKNEKVVSLTEAKKLNRIVIYQDYQCPACQMFESANLAQIKTWIDNGYATIEFHPISFLDGNSLNNYSSRAANAAYCVANSQPEKFFQLNTDLYYKQPQEGTAGPDNEGLKNILREAGVNVDSEINQCIDQTRYKVFIDKVTTTSLSENAVTGKAPVTGTPHVLVNGNLYPTSDLANPAAFAQFYTIHSKK